MLEQVLLQITRLLSQFAIPYMVIGGQAVLRYGEPRLTKDIDITLGVAPDRAAELIAAAPEFGLQPWVDDPQTFVARNLVLPYIHAESGIRVDFIFSLSPYERAAIERAQIQRVGDTPVQFATVEDLVILKVFSGRPRDMEDVRSILGKRNEFDMDYTRKWLRELQLGLDQDFVGVFDELWHSTRNLG
jgi:hypothetical protein